MRTRIALLVLVAAGCSSSPPSPEAPEAPQAPQAPPAESPPVPPTATPPDPAPPVTPPSTAAAPEPTPDLCTALCVEQRQMQAMSIEAIEGACRNECATLAGAPVKPGCAAAATAARDRADKAPMNGRAPLVWKQIDSAVACGHNDRVLERLSEIGTANSKTREADFLEALAADPFFTHLCPAGFEIAAEAATRPHQGRTQHLVEACPLAGVEPEGAARDLPVGTLLAIETVAVRWRAYGATSSNHAIMLDTLRLSSALAAAPR